MTVVSTYGWTLSEFNCILTHCDRRRCSRARALQALPGPLLTRPFRKNFHFFCISPFFPQKMRIWLNKVNRMICVWVTMWRMEKVPGQGLCTANRPAGRPARRLNFFPIIDRSSHSYTPVRYLKIDHWSIFKE